MSEEIKTNIERIIEKSKEVNSDFLVLERSMCLGMATTK